MVQHLFSFSEVFSVYRELIGLPSALLRLTVASGLGPVALCLQEGGAWVGKLPRVTHMQRAGPEVTHREGGPGWGLNLSLPPDSVVESP